MNSDRLKNAVAELDAEILSLQKQIDEVKQARQVLNNLISRNGKNEAQAITSLSQSVRTGPLTDLSQPKAIMMVLPVAPQDGISGRDAWTKLVASGKDIPLQNVRVILSRLVKKGKVEKVGDVYRVPSEKTSEGEIDRLFEK